MPELVGPASAPRTIEAVNQFGMTVTAVSLRMLLNMLRAEEEGQWLVVGHMDRVKLTIQVLQRGLEVMRFSPNYVDEDDKMSHFPYGG